MFREREFVYEAEGIVDGKTYFVRNVAFINCKDLKECFTNEAPLAIYNGAIFPKPVNQMKSKDQQIALAELKFDIDLDQYDDVRLCCQGKKMCSECWQEFIVPAVRFIHSVLT